MTRVRRALVAFVASLVFCALMLDADPRVLFDKAGLRNALEILQGLLAPDLSAATLWRLAGLALESLAIGVAGTSLALVLGVGLAAAAARLPSLDAPGEQPVRRLAARILRATARALLLFFRSVPEIIWAYLLVRIFGLGAGPAVIAIAITFSGILGKLYAELLESVDPEPVLALRSAGAGWSGALLYGALPQVRSEWMRYALFRLECGVRSGTVLGIVGAGGLGMEIDLAIRYLDYGALATCLLMILAIVGAVELGSAGLHRLRPGSNLAIGLVFSIASFSLLDVPWSRFFTGQAFAQLGAFASSFSHPNLAAGFLARAAGQGVETVAMAWLATGSVALLALAAAPFGVRAVARGWLAAAPRVSALRRALRVLSLLVARGLFQLFRTLPELVWALLFIVWVGPGVLAGVLAVAAHSFGILGRLFAEVAAETDPAPARTLEASGANSLAQWLYGVMPGALPRMAAYGLFRFEVNVRTTTMVGFVGAGGLGDSLHTALSLFHFSDLAGLLIVLLAIVALVDGVGDRVRAKLFAATSSTGRGRPVVRASEVG